MVHAYLFIFYKMTKPQIIINIDIDKILSLLGNSNNINDDMTYESDFEQEVKVSDLELAEERRRAKIDAEVKMKAAGSVSSAASPQSKDTSPSKKKIGKLERNVSSQWVDMVLDSSILNTGTGESLDDYNYSNEIDDDDEEFENNLKQTLLHK